jgi:serralysin
VALIYLNAAERGGTGPNGLTSLTINEAADQLTRDGYSWANNWGQAATVSYAYRASAPGSMPEDTAGFSRFSTAQINATELALQAWSDVANITFVRVGSGNSGSGAYSNSATILLGNYSSGEEGAAAFTYFPGSTGYSSFDGDLWVNSTFSYNANPVLNDYGQLVLVHELGHAIGLDHPGDYNAAPDVTITYDTDAAYFEDSMQYTVMSYFIESHTGGDFGVYYPATVMLDDIAAAQQL